MARIQALFFIHLALLAGTIEAWISGTGSCRETTSLLAAKPERKEFAFLADDTFQLGTLKVPSVGVGSISWSCDGYFTNKHTAVDRLVQEACNEYPGTLMDTAERYGSHYKTALGMGWGETEQMLQPGANDLTVATKFTPSPWRTSVQSVVDACKESCKRLGVESIDLYQLHMPDIVQLPFGEKKDALYWEGLAECYKQGLVKNVGVCNYGPTLLAQCQAALDKHNVPLASNQIAYSLLGRQVDGAQTTVEYCQNNGISVMAFFPFAMGLLTGKYGSRAKYGDSSLRRSKKTRLERADLLQYTSNMQPLMDVLEELSAHHSKTVAQVSLNYLLCKNILPIPGARTVDQLRDNMGAAGWRLAPHEVERLEMAADRLGFGFEGAGFKRTSEKFVGYGVERWALD